ncbi:hypothetical protein HKD27_15365 [Gluconobacter sp. R75690]|uniref:hypothetical protein n=1 Tax=unclassified Gluconobacter TaxID=2644261 RepID=UPI00188CA758|nr:MULTISPECIES: hypothetical protein [unclassified Gluconobacter]MBF0852264.1 hypothetical protein [Gluconobacter sp. R75690]MBF0880955.1 hypothetical protein [Gluconobacter sp. R75828]
MLFIGMPRQSACMEAEMSGWMGVQALVLCLFPELEASSDPAGAEDRVHPELQHQKTA